MATLVPHRQHSFMSPATWQARQGKQNIPQQPGRGRNTAAGEALPACPAPPASGKELGGPGYMAVAITPLTREAGVRKVSREGVGPTTAHHCRWLREGTTRGTHRRRSRCSSPSALSAICSSRQWARLWHTAAGSSRQTGWPFLVALLKETGGEQHG